MEEIQKNFGEESLKYQPLCGFCRGPIDDSCCGDISKYENSWIHEPKGESIQEDVIKLIQLMQYQKKIDFIVVDTSEQMTRDSIDLSRIMR